MSEHEIKTASTLRKAIRHPELARKLADAIAVGRYPVGGLLPTEFELCAQYGASRHTVRMAVAELEDLGLVSRRKKVGTRVQAAAPSAGYRQSLASVQDLIQFGAANRREYRGVAEVACDPDLAKLIGCEPGERKLRISTLRRAGGAAAQPLAWTDVYVDPRFDQLADLAQQSPEVLISSFIEQQYGERIVEIRQDVRAILTPERLAEALQTEVGAPALEVLRRYADATGRVFEVSISVHPADRFTLTTRLRRGREG